MTEHIPETPTQEELREFVYQHVIANQTLLVEHLLFAYDEANEFTSDDIRNRTNEDEAPEIFEWWIVTDGLANQLEKRNQPVLRNDFGTWWGRTCAGQAIYQDSIIQEIYTDTK